MNSLRILAVSDSHGALAPVERAIELTNPHIVVFLGDGLREVENLEYIYDGVKFYFVKGNCDMVGEQEECLFTAAGKRIFAAHGHRYGVKGGYGAIKEAARRRGADVVLFGHTHIPYEEYDDGLYVLNPGSSARPNTGKPSCGYVDIVGGSVLTNIVYI